MVLGKRTRADDASAISSGREASCKAGASAGEDSFMGKNVVCAGPLVYEEDADSTWYLSGEDFKAIITKRGGKSPASVNSKTEIVVLGDTTRMWSIKKAFGGSKWRLKAATEPPPADRWEGSAKQRAVEMQKGLAKRKLPFEVIRFKDFVSKFGLDAEVKHELRWASYKGKSIPVGWRRNSFVSQTMQWTTGPKRGKPCKSYHSESKNGDGMQFDRSYEHLLP